MQNFVEEMYMFLEEIYMFCGGNIYVTGGNIYAQNCDLFQIVYIKQSFDKFSFYFFCIKYPEKIFLKMFFRNSCIASILVF